MTKKSGCYLITIDGPSGAGKSTVARMVAQQLGYLYIDSGAMYRAVGLKAIQNHLSPDNTKNIVTLASRSRIELHPSHQGCRVFLDGIDVSEAIRTETVSQAASRISSIPEVRRLMVQAQQYLGRNGSVVMEGRDIGTKVFPDADLKIFLDASETTRAQRRFDQNRRKKQSLSLEKTLQEIQQRDQRDRQRTDSPLVQAQDAIYLDTSKKDINEVVQEILRLIKVVEKNNI